jgi:hypothetical protein
MPAVRPILELVPYDLELLPELELLLELELLREEELLWEDELLCEEELLRDELLWDDELLLLGGIMFFSLNDQQQCLIASSLTQLPDILCLMQL